jgi:hypothetical protein
MDVSMLAAFPFGPTDWAPDDGHGTVEVRQDAPWLTATPAGGTLEPGRSVTVTVRATAGGLAAGTHRADLRLTTGAGRVPRRTVPVRFTTT